MRKSQLDEEESVTSRGSSTYKGPVSGGKLAQQEKGSSSAG